MNRQRRTWYARLWPLWCALLAACNDSADGGSDRIVLPNLDAGSDLSLVESRQLTPRLLELEFSTPALVDGGSAPPESGAGSGKVRVLVPAGYASSSRRYPVLYLLHGAYGSYRDWTELGDAEAITEGQPLIVVMPDGGAEGEYTDHYNGGRYGAPAYETYHVDQLMPWIDLNLRTLGTRRGRAIAGTSMGGFGAMSYAARHPDLFVAATAFSGAVDTNQGPVRALIGDQIWGPRATSEVRWRGSNPVDLAANLRDMTLTLRSGNGEPGPLQPVFDLVESVVYRQSERLHQALLGLGIAHAWIDYGSGGHSWSYWQQGLRETLPDLMSRYALPSPVPAEIHYTSIAPRYEPFGWQVSLQRAVTEFSTLSGAGRSGFTLSGSGIATVRTPPAYRPGSAHDVAIAGDKAASLQRMEADADGRLSITLPLGPDNPHQQFTLAAAIAGTQVYSSTVTIDPVP